jgi:hypothetical protein
MARLFIALLLAACDGPRPLETPSAAAPVCRDPATGDGAPRASVPAADPPSPQPVSIPPAPLCEPLVSCGCYTACADFVPDATDPAIFRRTGGGRWAYRPASAGTGALVCDQYGRCSPPLVTLDEPCAGSCQPAPAPFHCARVPTGACTRVDYGLTIDDVAPTSPPRARIVRRVIDQRRGDLDRCFGQTSVDGQLTLHVGANGVARRVDVGSMPPATRSCVRRLVGRWRFPTGDPVAVSLRVRYEPRP